MVLKTSSAKNSGTSSLHASNGPVENHSVSMYVELLSSRVDEQLEELTGDELVDYVVACRADMLAAAPYGGNPAWAALATEIIYDRALLKLCAVKTIKGSAADFTHPSDERKHLELKLSGAGIDLVALTRRRRQQGR